MTHTFLKHLFLSTFLLGSALMGTDGDVPDDASSVGAGDDGASASSDPTAAPNFDFSGTDETADDGVKTRSVKMSPPLRAPAAEITKRVNKRREEDGEHFYLGINAAHPHYLNVQFPDLQGFITQCTRIYETKDEKSSLFSIKAKREAKNIKRKARRDFVSSLCTEFAKFSDLAKVCTVSQKCVLKEMFYGGDDVASQVVFVVKSKDTAAPYKFLSLDWNVQGKYFQFKKSDLSPADFKAKILEMRPGFESDANYSYYSDDFAAAVAADGSAPKAGTGSKKKKAQQ